VVNEDGSLAISSTRIFDGNTFAILGLLPITTTTMAISSDHQTLYLYDLSSSRLYLFDVSAF
jgi:hypothetical protein